MDSQHMTLGTAIRHARIKKGYTQEYLSEKLNITPGHLQHMESDRRKPSVPMLFQIMQLLDMSVDTLIFSNPQKTLCVDGLTDQQILLLEQLIYTMQK